LIARDDELNALRDSFADCARGAGRIVMIRGLVGMGKTTLLHAFAEQAARADAVVLTATCSSAERDLPLSAVAQLFCHARIPADYRARFAAALDQGRRECEDAAGQDDAMLRKVRARTARGLLDVLLDMAEEAPVVIGVDDVQHMDEGSLQVVLYFALRTQTARILMILGESTNVTSRYPELRSEITRLPHHRRVRLSPLSPRHVIRVLAESLDGAAARAIAAETHRVSGGNPLLVRGLIEDCLTGADPESGTAPRVAAGPAYGDAALELLRRAGQDALRVARAVAVFADPPPVPLVARLLGLSTHAVRHTVDMLTVAGVFEADRFRGESARSAVLDDMAAQDLATMRLLAAELLHQTGAAATVVASYLLAAGRAPHRWAVHVLRDEAAHALDDGRFDAALDCLDLAHASSSDARERAVIAASRARMESRQHPWVASRRFPQLTDSIAEGHLRGREAIAVVHDLLWHGRFDAARAALRSLAESSRSVDAQGAAELQACRLWLACTYPPLLAAAPPPAPAMASGTGLDTGLDTVLGAMDPHLHAVALSAELLANMPRQEIALEAERVLRNCRPHEAAHYPVLAALEILLWTGHLDGAGRWCRALLGSAAVARGALAQASLARVQADLALRRGDPVAAAALGRHALWHVPPRGWGVGIGAPLATLILANTATKNYSEAARHLNESVPTEMHHSRFGLPYRHARGHYYLATGHVHAALRDFQVCGELMRKWDIDQPSYVPWRTDLAQALVALGRNAEAMALAEEELARIGAARSRARGIGLRVLAATVPAKQRLPFLIESAEMLEECGDRLQLATALTDLSDAYHAAGKAARARGVRRRAARVADACGVPRSAETGPTSQSERANAPVGAGTLTAAERRVATLAGQGYTNREVAQKLYLSVSTVEQHLSRVYRKLNVNRRAELPVGL